ncbi:DUF2029 domain-containing protein [Arthrobacter gandavensis]|uniref:glycosyltransferase 87 family protein n=1 Tax=Arthrobacter gandavensis TaxID=169960 RepID=UPI0018901901|nr:glycosyltransferase 87 family protein [Arthrobacter gandavensis]MBF4994376.1 DUF2029 domain-containing protein [Arthrobacter gandavensis]
MPSRSRTPSRLPLVAVLFQAGALTVLAAGVHNLDFFIYRAGARAFLGMDGTTALYDAQLWQVREDFWLPFTYPPFAVVFFLPYAVLPSALGAAAHTAFLTACLIAVSLLIARHAPAIRHRLQVLPPGRGTLAAGAMVVLTGLSAPWREGLSFGQVNAVLMLVILWDLLERHRFLPRGLLTGLAAGVKLTPLAMGLFFAAQKDWKAVLWLGIGFFGSVAAGFALTLQGSVRYWTEALFSTTRVGNDDDMYSLTLRAFTQRLGLSDGSAAALWAVLSLAAACGGYAAIRKLLAAQDRLSAVGIAALVMLVISPISWFHHWVWFVLLVPALVFPPGVSRRRKRRLWCGAGSLYLLFLFSSLTLSLAQSGTIRGWGPWWLELVSSVWMFAAIAAAGVITVNAARAVRGGAGASSAADVQGSAT